MDKQVLVHNKYEMGIAPYRHIGVWSAPTAALAEANTNAYNNAWASKPACCHCSCDHCGTGIVHHHIIQDSTGKKFAVGSSCIDKLHDTKLTSAAKHAEKLRQREIRRAKAQAERDRINYIAELRRDAERVVNGGLTDYEVEQEELAKKEAARKQQFANAGEEIISILKTKNGDFCAGLVYSMKQGFMPDGYAKNICIEIIAKQSGRKGSKKYEAALPAAHDLFEETEAKFEALKKA